MRERLCYCLSVSVSLSVSIPVSLCVCGKNFARSLCAKTFRYTKIIMATFSFVYFCFGFGFAACNRQLCQFRTAKTTTTTIKVAAVAITNYNQQFILIASIVHQQFVAVSFFAKVFHPVWPK